MSFYPDAAADAVELLTEFGASVILTRPGTGDFDPATGLPGTGADALYTAQGVALSYKQDEIDGSLIRQGDRKVLIDPTLPVTPQSGDSLSLSTGEVLRVMASSPLAPAGVTVLHTVQCRGVAL